MHNFVKFLFEVSPGGIILFGELQMVKLIWYKLTALIIPNPKKMGKQKQTNINMF